MLLVLTEFWSNSGWKKTSQKRFFTWRMNDTVSEVINCNQLAVFWKERSKKRISDQSSLNWKENRSLNCGCVEYEKCGLNQCDKKQSGPCIRLAELATGAGCGVLRVAFIFFRCRDNLLESADDLTTFFPFLRPSLSATVSCCRPAGFSSAQNESSDGETRLKY